MQLQVLIESLFYVDSGTIKEFDSNILILEINSLIFGN